MKALIIGATGVTGKDLVDILLNDSDYKEVVIFVRRHTGMDHPKLEEILTDFGQL
jgi:N-acetyl-gamma-glutamylphosphate reductase